MLAITLNGDAVGTSPVVTEDWANISAPFEIGNQQAGTPGIAPSDYFNGHTDEVRFSNVARWTSNFIPPSAPYEVDANTLLLMHMDTTENAGAIFPDASGRHSPSPVNGTSISKSIKKF